MNRQENLNKMIEEALSSVDDAQRAEPRPFLLTRINVRMYKGTESFWEKAGWFISRPAVAFTGLCMIVLLNLLVVMFNKAPDSAVQTEADEFSYTATTIYDIDNTP